MTPTSSEKIAQALFEVVTNAPDYERRELFAVLQEWRGTYERSYKGVKRQPFARNLIEAIEEAEKFVSEMEGEIQ